MKVEFSWKALQHYRWRRSPDGGGWCEPNDDAPVHAVLLNHPHRLSRFWTRDLRNLTTVEYLRTHESVPAVCGRSVRVVYPMAFDPDDAEENLCQACTSMLDARGLIGEVEFWRQVDSATRRESRLEWQRRRKQEPKSAAADPLLDADSTDVHQADAPGGRLQELMAQEDAEADDDGWRTAMFEGLLERDTQQHPPAADGKGA